MSKGVQVSDNRLDPARAPAGHVSSARQRFEIGRSSITRWVMALVLALPFIVPYITHTRVGLEGGLPTGFILYDMLSYMANAREHFDDGSFSLIFGNPFSYSYDTPKIYFQPLTLLFGLLLSTGADPGLVYVLVHLVAALAFVRVSIALFETLFGLTSWAHWTALVIFFWGGGLLTVAGILYSAVKGLDASHIFDLDAGYGWWFLNLGRNILFATEAFYHALFLGAILLLVRQRYAWALAVAAFLSLNHPFSGVQLLLVLLAWASLERLFLVNTKLPKYFLILSAVLLVCHVGYYVAFLNTFPEHRLLFERWKISWLLQAKNFLPAYALVGGLAFWGARRIDLAREVLSVPYNRLFLIWFVVSFALANHEFAFNPVQPLHFTRGYIWTPLFLLGAPVLIRLLQSLVRRYRALGLALSAAAVSVFLFDNAAWLAAFPFRTEQGLRITPGEVALFEWMNRPENARTVLLSQPKRKLNGREFGSLTSYLASAYTPLRAWVSHFGNTPDYDRRFEEAHAFYEKGQLPPSSGGVTFLAVYDRALASHVPVIPAQRAARWVYENPEFRVMRIEPASSAPGVGPVQ